MWLCHDWLLADFQVITIDITEYGGNTENCHLWFHVVSFAAHLPLFSLLNNVSDLGVASHPVPLYDLDVLSRSCLATCIHSCILYFLSGHYN